MLPRLPEQSKPTVPASVAAEIQNFTALIAKPEQPRFFQVEFFKSQKESIYNWINLNETCFILDHNYRDETISNGSSHQQQ